MVMTYNVLDVCRHVINYSEEKDYGISNMIFLIEYSTKKKIRIRP